MNSSVLLTVPRQRLPSGLPIALLGLVLSCPFLAMAESISVGAFPDREPGYAASSLPEENNALTLRDAVRFALQRNPELASFAKEMRALEGVTLQVGLLRNPELVVNVENAGNVRPLHGERGLKRSGAAALNDTTQSTDRARWETRRPGCCGIAGPGSGR